MGSNGTGYFVDDVAVYDLDSFLVKADAGADALVRPGDSVFIGGLTNGISFLRWYDAQGNMIDSVRPGFWAKPLSSTFYVLEQSVCGRYSRDTVNITVGPLPVTARGFDARVEGKAVVLRLESLADRPLRSVGVERSTGTDGPWAALGNAEARPDGQYFYTDNAPRPGTNRYRPLLTAADGTKRQGPVVSVDYQTDNGPIVRAWPNPAHGKFKVSGLGIFKTVITDLSGRIVIEKAMEKKDVVDWDLSHLTKGHYLMKIEDTNGISTFRILLLQ